MAWNVQWYWAAKKEWITLQHPLCLARGYDYNPPTVNFPVEDRELARKAAIYFSQEHVAQTRLVEVKVKA